MKTRAIVAILVLFCSTALFAQVPATATSRPERRPVQAVQYPYNQKVHFDHLYSTGRLNGVSGSAEVLQKKTIAVEVSIDAPPASQLKPEYKGYVVWALARDGKFTNLGPIEAKGKLKTTTALPAFGIVVTAESDLTAATPGDAVLESGMPDAKKRYYPIYKVFYTPKY